MIRQLALASTLSFLLISCVKVPTTSSPEIVVLWHTFEALSEDTALQTLGDLFNAQHPDGPTLVVEYQNDILEKLSALPEDRWPDLVVTSADNVPQLREESVTFDVPASLRRDLLPMAASLYTDDEALYALPLGLATYVLYYNQVWIRDLGYQAASATADDLLNTACAATDMEGGQIGLGIPAQADVLVSLLATSGASVVDERGQYAFDNADVVSAADLGHKLLSRGCGRLYEFLDIGIDQFADGTMALLISSSLSEPAVVNQVLTGRNFTIGVADLPMSSGEGGSLWRGPAILPLTATGSNRAAVQDVALWMLSSEAQAIWFEETNFLPVRRSLAETWLEDQDLRASRQALLALTLAATEQENWSTWLPVTDEPECRAALVRALFDLNTDQPVADVLSSAQAACEQVNGEQP